MTGGDGDILRAVDLEGDRPGSHLAAETSFPQYSAVSRIESVKVTFTSAGKEQIGGSGEDAAVGDVGH